MLNLKYIMYFVLFINLPIGQAWLYLALIDLKLRTVLIRHEIECTELIKFRDGFDVICKYDVRCFSLLLLLLLLFLHMHAYCRSK